MQFASARADQRDILVVYRTFPTLSGEVAAAQSLRSHAQSA